MNNLKEVETKASVATSAGGVSGGTGKLAKSDGAVTTGGTAKDTPGAKVCADAGVGQTMMAQTTVKGTGTPAPKKQKVVGEVTPPEIKGATMCESCNKRELKAGKDQNNCDRCGKTAVCNFCTTVCGKCEDSICNKCSSCGSGGAMGWHNEVTYCEICGEYRCGKCGGDDFDSLCEDSSEGLVCRDCVEKAEAGYFDRGDIKWA